MAFEDKHLSRVRGAEAGKKLPDMDMGKLAKQDPEPVSFDPLLSLVRQWQFDHDQEFEELLKLLGLRKFRLIEFMVELGRFARREIPAEYVFRALSAQVLEPLKSILEKISEQRDNIALYEQADIAEVYVAQVASEGEQNFRALARVFKQHADLYLKLRADMSEKKLTRLTAHKAVEAIVQQGVSHLARLVGTERSLRSVLRTTELELGTSFSQLSTSSARKQRTAEIETALTAYESATAVLRKSSEAYQNATGAFFSSCRDLDEKHPAFKLQRTGFLRLENFFLEAGIDPYILANVSQDEVRRHFEIEDSESIASFPDIPADIEKITAQAYDILDRIEKIQPKQAQTPAKASLKTPVVIEVTGSTLNIPEAIAIQKSALPSALSANPKTSVAAVAQSVSQTPQGVPTVQPVGSCPVAPGELAVVLYSLLTRMKPNGEPYPSSGRSIEKAFSAILAPAGFAYGLDVRAFTVAVMDAEAIKLLQYYNFQRGKGKKVVCYQVSKAGYLFAQTIIKLLPIDFKQKIEEKLMLVKQEAEMFRGKIKARIEEQKKKK